MFYDTVMKHSVRDVGNIQMGLKGFDEVTGSENGDWFAFKAIGGTATLSATSVVGDNLSSVQLQNGDTIFGNFSAVAVTDGTVLAYRNFA